MTLEECTAMLTPLAIALRVQMDVPMFRAYHRALQDVPAQWLQAAIDLAMRQPRAAFEPTFPAAPTLRSLAERARAAARAAKVFQPCGDCNGTGWQEIEEGNVVRVKRCGCWNDYQAELVALGLRGPSLSEAPRQLEAGDDFDPRMAQMGGDR